MKLVWKVRRRRVSVQRSGLLIWKCFQQIQTLSQRLKFLRFLIFRYLCKIFGTLLVSFSSIKCNNGGNSTMALSLGGDGGSKMQVLSSAPSEQTFHHFDADLGVNLRSKTMNFACIVGCVCLFGVSLFTNPD